MSGSSVGEWRPSYFSSLTFSQFKLQSLFAVTFMGSFGTCWNCLRRADAFLSKDTYSWGTTLIEATTQSRRFCCFSFTSSNILKQWCCWGAITNQGTFLLSTVSTTKLQRNMAITMSGTTSQILSIIFLWLQSLKGRSFVYTEVCLPKEPLLILSGLLNEMLKSLPQGPYVIWCGQIPRTILKIGSPVQEWLAGFLAGKLLRNLNI